MAEELQKLGIICDIVHGYDKKAYLKFLMGLLNNDLVYFQKRYTTLDLLLQRLAHLLGKRTFFDIDDAPARFSTEVDKQARALKMMERVSAVITGGHRLLALANQHNDTVYFIPTPINLKFYHPRARDRDRERIIIGWIGNGREYKQDLQMLLRPLERIGQHFPIEFHLIGALHDRDLHEQFSRLDTVPVKIVDALEWADPLAVPSAISEFDIGVYPLLENEYNTYKCGFKALEYMAMKVPVIASPVGENNHIIEPGTTGLFAANEEEWVEHLVHLIEHPEIRHAIGEAGRSMIEERFALDVCAERLAGYLKQR